MVNITKTQTYTWEPLGALGRTWETPKPASNLWSLQETQGVDGSKIKSIVDTIFRIRRKIVTYYIFTILSFSDIACHSNFSDYFIRSVTDLVNSEYPCIKQ